MKTFVSSLSRILHAGRAHPWALFAAALLLVPASHAQNRGEGVMHLTSWPTPVERANLDHQVLPFIDTLYVSYAYDVIDGEPALRFALEWLPEGEAILRGERRPLEERDVRMVAVELEAGVFVDGIRAATLSLVVDSMNVGPSPDFVEINLPQLGWENVFVDVSEEEARSLFAEGFALREPEFMHVAFALYERDTGMTGEVRRPQIGRPVPREVTIYDGPRAVDVGIDLVWLLGGNRDIDRRGDGTPRGTAGRGSLTDGPRSRSGRSAADRTEQAGDAETSDRDDRSPDRAGERERESRGRGIMDVITGGADKGDDHDDDNDDEDDDKLVPYAVAAVGAAGLLAVAGGTIGYFGNAQHARYGITSGLVRQNGGLLLQVGVNEALLTDADGPKNVVAKLLAFGRLFPGSVQPALGAGVMATSRGSDIAVEPSISMGAVTQASAFLLYAGYDFYQSGFELGLALNFRQLGLWR